MDTAIDIEKLLATNNESSSGRLCGDAFCIGQKYKYKNMEFELEYVARDPAPSYCYEGLPHFRQMFYLLKRVDTEGDGRYTMFRYSNGRYTAPKRIED